MMGKHVELTCLSSIIQLSQFADLEKWKVCCHTMSFTFVQFASSMKNDMKFFLELNMFSSFCVQLGHESQKCWKICNKS